MKKIQIIGCTLLVFFSASLIFSNSTNAAPIDFEFTFLEGWNLITIPVANNYMASELAENITDCLSISRWDQDQQTYRGYIVEAGFEDFQIEDGFGLYIHVNSSSSFTVSGEPLSNIVIPLVEGWTMLGWYESYSTTASSIMASIGGCIKVRIWDAVNQNYKNYTSSADEDFTISRGMGYELQILGLDSTPPVTSAQLSGSKDGNDWYISDVTVTLSATDSESSIFFTKYSLDGGSWQTYQSPLAISDDGTHTISYYSVDYSGNVEDMKSTNFEINKVTLEQLSISTQSSVNEGNEFQVTVSADGASVSDASVIFNGNTFLTNLNGIVTLTAPSVSSDTSYTITASKTGYLSSQISVLIKDEQTNIELLSPNGGDTWSNTNTIIWSISDPPLNPYAVTIQYKYKDNMWQTITENVLDENNLYYWDTNNVQSGYPYLIKVILKEDKNSDGTYENIVSEDSSDNSFTVDNSVTHEGQIYGQVTSSGVLIDKTRVYVIISDEGDVITSKFTFTDEDGNYSIQISSGSYTMEISKEGYQTTTISDVTVWVNEATVVNINLIPSETTEPAILPILTEDNRDLIDDGIKNNTIGGELVIKSNEQQTDFEKFIFIYNDVTISVVNAKEDNLSFLVNGDETSGGRTIVVNLEEGVFDFSKDFVIEYDGEPMEMADDISDVLNPNDDGSHPEYLITIGAQGVQILISIPHFSEHQISFFPASLEEIIEGIMQYKEYAIIGAIVVIAIAAVVMFRKGKEN